MTKPSWPAKYPFGVQRVYGNDGTERLSGFETEYAAQEAARSMAKYGQTARAIEMATGKIVFPKTSVETFIPHGDLPIFTLYSYVRDWDQTRRSWHVFSSDQTLAKARSTMAYHVERDPYDGPDDAATKWRIVNVVTGEIVQEEALKGDADAPERLKRLAANLRAAAALYDKAAALQPLNRMRKELEAEAMYELAVQDRTYA